MRKGGRERERGGEEKEGEREGGGREREREIKESVCKEMKTI